MGQGCCSGGAPISANLGFASAPKNTWQFASSFDVNNLNKLKEGSETLSDSDRTRQTNSVLLSVGYTFSNRISFDATFIPYVRQIRKVVIDDVTSEFTVVEGVGDLILLPKWLLSNPENKYAQLQLAIGVKAPTGHSSIRINSIEANPDIQPGTGAWDGIFWLNYYQTFNFRRSLGLTSTVNFRLTGQNEQYLQTHIYEFGDDLHWLTTFSDQWVLGTSLLSPSAGMRYRLITGTEIDLNRLDNTGGQWLTSVIGLSWSVNNLPTISVLGEIPVYSSVVGTQLSTSYRFSVGLQYSIGQLDNAD